MMRQIKKLCFYVGALLFVLLGFMMPSEAATGISIEPTTSTGENWEISADDGGIRVKNTDDGTTNLRVDNNGNTILAHLYHCVFCNLFISN
jgi:hypothetical protein